MTDSYISRSEPLVRSPSAVQRTGSATDRQHRRDQDRRDREEPNRKRRRIYDLLFDEIDEIDSLEPAQRARIKQNLRTHLASRGPPQTPQPPGLEDEHLATTLIEEHAAAVPVDHDHIVHMAAPTHAQLSPQETEENAILARQLRDCLGRHTVTARRVAVYLHLLLAVDGALRPHTVVDA